MNSCSVDGCSRPVKRRGWCNTHSARWYRNRSVDVVHVDQFSRYQVDPDTRCWIWQGRINQWGYGQISKRYGTQVAHRAFYMHHVGEIPHGLQLDHLCRVRCCVNPEHQPVTGSENLRRGIGGYGARDLCKAGLHDITDPANVYTPPGAPTRRTCKPCADTVAAKNEERQRAARSPRTRLTADQVARIRFAAAHGAARQALADEYGVSRSCIRHIVDRTNWRSVA